MVNLALDHAKNMETLVPAKKLNHNHMSGVDEFLWEIGTDIETGAQKLHEEMEEMEMDCRRSRPYNFDHRQYSLMVEMQRSNKMVHDFTSHNQLGRCQNGKSRASCNTPQSHRSAKLSIRLLKALSMTKILVIPCALL
ncbi:hypothetical protein Tcan_03355 [Toxocara canis]|uniref:Uncharacterized protein n=1 Tax=Toxocara canis TaxID=6265 RepID=A0A0B2W2F3_TOXCA|nr:hypothetical protein Tcan_03355 [Toxocara canis]